MTEHLLAVVEPFAGDMLERKPAAEFLTKYLIGRHRASKTVPGNSSFVLNLNAERGLGKTYFLTEWAKVLRSEGYLVVYFDAWANDYSANPGSNQVRVQEFYDTQAESDIGTWLADHQSASSVVSYSASVAAAVDSCLAVSPPT